MKKVISSVINQDHFWSLWSDAATKRWKVSLLKMKNIIALTFVNDLYLLIRWRERERTTKTNMCPHLTSFIHAPWENHRHWGSNLKLIQLSDSFLNNRSIMHDHSLPSARYGRSVSIDFSFVQFAYWFKWLFLVVSQLWISSSFTSSNLWHWENDCRVEIFSVMVSETGWW